MRFGCPIISVKDLAISKAFYEKVLSQKVLLDLGANVTFGNETSVFAIQADYAGLVGANDFYVSYKGNDHELYFEENNFDDFEKRLNQFDNIIYLHRTKEYPWGQRVIRFYDPDSHVIEVGEGMGSVFEKFKKQGMSIEEVAQRTQHPVEFVKEHINFE